ncbi:SM-20-related protein [Bdellovibrio bacteriovorus W]|nr:SM-20-related protein [Bdellovibrio bacteriovorus W]
MIIPGVELLLQELAEKGWVAVSNIFPANLVEALAQECLQLQSLGALQAASIGVQGKSINSHIRGDSTYWLEENSLSPDQKIFFAYLKALQEQLNQAFFIGIQRVESHFAIYPPSARYAKHLDTPPGQQNRKITFVLYLNRQWQSSCGGQLSLFKPEASDELLTQIEPRFGSFVLFRSDLFPHQVEVCGCDRLSLTGWFRSDGAVF